MRLTIIKPDNAVYVNGVACDGIDLGWIPTFDENEVHAVQWHDDHGEIEFTTTVPNLEIAELGIFERAIPLWEERRQEILEYEQEQIRLREEAETAALLASQQALEDAETDDNYDDIYYDIEELLKEI
jgi:hypothetical protein